jgi:uncharacterized protein (TIGR02444 family)
MVRRADAMSPTGQGAFWRFSLRFYERPGVAAACLDLQDGEGRDVNLLLYAAWLGVSGRGRPSAADLAAAEAAIAPWRREVVEPLQSVRRRVKEEPGAAELYAALKAAELEAEQAAQHRLELLAPAPRAASSARRLADARANLRACLGHDAPAALHDALAAELRA